jgi:hypothetical protein
LGGSHFDALSPGDLDAIALDPLGGP